MVYQPNNGDVNLSSPKSRPWAVGHTCCPGNSFQNENIVSSTSGTRFTRLPVCLLVNTGMSTHPPSPLGSILYPLRYHPYVPNTIDYYVSGTQMLEGYPAGTRRFNGFFSARPQMAPKYTRVPVFFLSSRVPFSTGSRSATPLLIVLATHESISHSCLV